MWCNIHSFIVQYTNIPHHQERQRVMQQVSVLIRSEVTSRVTESYWPMRGRDGDNLTYQELAPTTDNVIIQEKRPHARLQCISLRLLDQWSYTSADAFSSSSIFHLSAVNNQSFSRRTQLQAFTTKERSYSHEYIYTFIYLETSIKSTLYSTAAFGGNGANGSNLRHNGM